ncbi:MAG TPA: hypothetical protein VMW24_13460 [Sedimentisphaerales bacterium]|nr:hypothetical protein [Sedimentisphaerales bacterium]
MRTDEERHAIWTGNNVSAKIDLCAETLLSMCTDRLMGGLDDETFVSNVESFAKKLGEVRGSASS